MLRSDPRDAIPVPCAVPVTIPRKVANAYASQIRGRRTGNFIIHIRDGEALGFTFEQKESLRDVDRSDTVALG